MSVFAWSTIDGSHSWFGLSCSSSGQYIIAVAYNSGYIYVSNDYGASFTQCGTMSYFQGCSCSSTGQYMLAVDGNGNAWYSTNYGVTWNSQYVAENPQDCCINSDGSIMLIPGYSDYIYISVNYGTTWASLVASGAKNWYGVACSYNGAKIVAITNNEDIYTSTNYGVAWTQRTGAGTTGFQKVCSSSDGATLLACKYGGYLWLSTDSGATWNQKGSSLGWRGVCMTADASVMMAGTLANGLYISTDGGNTWVQETSLTTTGSRVDRVAINSTALIAYIVTYDYSGEAMQKGVIPPFNVTPAVSSKIRTKNIGTALRKELPPVGSKIRGKNINTAIKSVLTPTAVNKMRFKNIGTPIRKFIPPTAVNKMRGNSVVTILRKLAPIACGHTRLNNVVTILRKLKPVITANTRIKNIVTITRTYAAKVVSGTLKTKNIVTVSRKSAVAACGYIRFKQISGIVRKLITPTAINKIRFVAGIIDSFCVDAFVGVVSRFSHGATILRKTNTVSTTTAQFSVSATVLRGIQIIAAGVSKLINSVSIVITSAAFNVVATVGTTLKSIAGASVLRKTKQTLSTVSRFGITAIASRKTKPVAAAKLRLKTIVNTLGTYNIPASAVITYIPSITIQRGIIAVPVAKVRVKAALAVMWKVITIVGATAKSDSECIIVIYELVVKPSLVFPIAGETVYAPTGVFMLTNNEPDAIGFQIQISDAPDFSNIIIDEVVPNANT